LQAQPQNASFSGGTELLAIGPQHDELLELDEELPLDEPDWLPLAEPEVEPEALPLVDVDADPELLPLAERDPEPDALPPEEPDVDPDVEPDALPEPGTEPLELEEEDDPLDMIFLRYVQEFIDRKPIGRGSALVNLCILQRLAQFPAQNPAGMKPLSRASPQEIQWPAAVRNRNRLKESGLESPPCSRLAIMQIPSQIFREIVSREARAS
jgi:hypothetical protein